ncbi:hypothetical protein [Arthrobacter sp. QXT-31]|uniref:hypothetical protein n=1 Tax=Arthrobacter sp. QXT-31 TaxID=1357915 RepID=UPI001F3FCBE5|nr:hypothetical protein [Arthrobacter sp. QXT-31]
METLVGTLSKAGSIHKVVGGYTGLPSMNEPGTVAAIGDSLHNPEGSVMSAGFFELKASEPLVYTYTYDEMKVVIAGEFILTDETTGEVTHARERDVLFFPKARPSGSKPPTTASASSPATAPSPPDPPGSIPTPPRVSASPYRRGSATGDPDP